MHNSVKRIMLVTTVTTGLALTAGARVASAQEEPANNQAVTTVVAPSTAAAATTVPTSAVGVLPVTPPSTLALAGAATISQGTLPNTGSDPSIAVKLGVGIGIGGLGLVLVSRRRRPARSIV